MKDMGKDIKKSQGKMLEEILERRGIKIVELAKQLNVNRRTIYNWFERETLKENLIHRISDSISINLFQEYPEVFGVDKNLISQSEKQELTNEYIIKYNRLLEAYLELQQKFNTLDLENQKLRFKL